MDQKPYDYIKVIELLQKCEIEARDVTEALILLRQGNTMVKIRDISINKVYQTSGSSINYYVDVLSNFKLDGRLLSHLKIRRSNQKKSQIIQQPKFWSCGYNTLFKLGSLDLHPSTTCDAYIFASPHRQKYLQNESAIADKMMSFIT